MTSTLKSFNHPSKLLLLLSFHIVERGTQMLNVGCLQVLGSTTASRCRLNYKFESEKYLRVWSGSLTNGSRLWLNCLRSSCIMGSLGARLWQGNGMFRIKEATSLVLLHWFCSCFFITDHCKFNSISARLNEWRTVDDVTVIIFKGAFNI